MCLMKFVAVLSDYTVPSLAKIPACIQTKSNCKLQETATFFCFLQFGLFMLTLVSSCIF